MENKENKKKKDNVLRTIKGATNSIDSLLDWGFITFEQWKEMRKNLEEAIVNYAKEI